nr:hypothetical protein [Tanacetum cinerariifolium]
MTLASSTGMSISRNGRAHGDIGGVLPAETEGVLPAETEELME